MEFNLSRQLYSLLNFTDGFVFEDLELEDDLVFKARHPSNKFIIHSLVAYDGVRRFISASVRYAILWICWMILNNFGYTRNYYIFTKYMPKFAINGFVL